MGNEHNGCSECTERVCLQGIEKCLLVKEILEFHRYKARSGIQKPHKIQSIASFMDEQKREFEEWKKISYQRKG